MDNDSAADSVDSRDDPPNKKRCTLQQPPTVDAEGDYYDMTCEQRGIAIIFDNFEFDSEQMEERKGLEKDGRHMEITFRKLGFGVEKYSDLTQNEIEVILQKAAKSDHRHNDCIVVIFLRHGRTSQLIAGGGSHTVSEPWKPFIESQSLIGKPKIFLMQVRGEESGAKKSFSKAVGDMVDSRYDQPRYFKIPTMADLLVMSYEEFVGSLSRDRGSRFSEALCKELDENGESDDLLYLLTGVNRRVASGLQSDDSGDEEHTMKPMSSIVSTLTKNFYFTPKGTRSCTLQQPPSTVASPGTYYDMTHEQRGLAIIFDHFEFDSKDMKKRKGTEMDRQRLEITFRKLGFDVVTYKDRSHNEIKRILRKAATEMDHQRNDCIAVIVLSHGGVSRLEARDTNYDVNELWEPFLNCQSLIGKPKLFFIQACRGTTLDPGLAAMATDPGFRTGDMMDSPDFSSQYFEIPSTADLLVMYATYEGYFAWRNEEKGSCFIQTLCNEFDANGTKDDLLRLLTGVNRKVAVTFQSVHSDSELNAKKQMPTIVSMLTKTLYFTEKN